MTTKNMRRGDGEGNPMSRRAVLGRILTGTAAACVAVAVPAAVANAAPEVEALAPLSEREQRIIAAFRRMTERKRSMVEDLVDTLIGGEPDEMAAPAEPEPGVYVHTDGTKWRARQDIGAEPLCIIQSRGVALLALEPYSG